MNLATRSLILSLAVVAVTACGKHRSAKSKGGPSAAAKAIDPSAEIVNTAGDSEYQIKVSIPESNGTLSTHLVSVDSTKEKNQQMSGAVVYTAFLGNNILDTIIYQQQEGKTLMLHVFGRKQDITNSFTYIGKQMSNSETAVLSMIDSMKAFASCYKTSVAAQFKLHGKNPNTQSVENSECKTTERERALARAKELTGEIEYATPGPQIPNKQSAVEGAQPQMDIPAKVQVASPLEQDSKVALP